MNTSAVTSAYLQNRVIPAEDLSARYQSPFLKACRGEETPVTPVWLMRQAGRYMEEYRAIRKKVSFLELCKNPELCAEVAIFAQETLGADAAILFSDLLPILETFGFKVEYGKGESPLISGVEISEKGLNDMPEIDPAESLSYVFDAVKTTRQYLNSQIPLIGFAGAPFTLASYLIEGKGSRTFHKTKQFMYQHKPVWDALLKKINRGLIPYLKGQAAHGADALQIFDSWVGCLSAQDYEIFVKPHSHELIEALGKEVPVIHFGTSSAHLLKQMSEAGGDVIGVDFKTSLTDARQSVGEFKTLQGNLDPSKLFAPRDYLLKEAKTILDEINPHQRFIFNLGHGILPETPVQQVKDLIQYVHDYTAER